MIEDPDYALSGSSEEEEPRIDSVGGASEGEEQSTDIQEEEPMGTSTTGTPAADVETQPVESAETVPDHLSADVENPVETRTWSSYSDPVAAATGARLRQEQEDREKQEEITAAEYRFMGHSNPYNETRVLVTRVGTVKIGQNIKLPDDELERLRGLGFRFDTAAQA